MSILPLIKSHNMLMGDMAFLAGLAELQWILKLYNPKQSSSPIAGTE